MYVRSDSDELFSQLERSSTKILTLLFFVVVLMSCTFIVQKYPFSLMETVIVLATGQLA